MRKIKFRGKRIDNKRWAYGYYLETKISGVYIIGTIMDCKLWQYEVDPATVGQYTGLKVNEEEVYEGDILQMYFKDGKKAGEPFVIEWDEERAEFTKWHPKNCAKIIGNIHDNPELLEVQP